MRTLLTILVLSLVPLTCEAQGTPVHHSPVAKVAYAMGGELKRTFYTDFKEHPSHVFNVLARTAFILADTGSTCYGLRQGFVESNPILGKHPGCPKTVGWSLGYILASEPIVNRFSHDFEDSCRRDASDPNSPYNKVPAHTHSTKACYWGPQLGYTIAVGSVEIPAVIGNIRLLEKR